MRALFEDKNALRNRFFLSLKVSHSAESFHSLFCSDLLIICVLIFGFFPRQKLVCLPTFPPHTDRLSFTLNRNPLAQMEEEKREHDAKMKKMEAEMEQVFEMKVKEKKQKLKDSELELTRRHEERKKVSLPDMKNSNYPFNSLVFSSNPRRPSNFKSASWKSDARHSRWKRTIGNIRMASPLRKCVEEASKRTAKSESSKFDYFYCVDSRDP